jgi:hypothetical protein
LWHVVSKSNFALTVAVPRFSATIEIRSNVACASSFGLVRKNSMVKFITRLLFALRQAYHGNERLRAACSVAWLLISSRCRFKFSDNLVTDGL